MLTWDSIRQYCVPLWYEDGNKLKALVEKLAMIEYKKQRDPDDVILYYIAMGKLPVLLTLYRSQAPPNPKMVGFLSNDFKDARWQTAAVKNAYVLLSQKKYFMSTAFFLLGGKLKEALDVVVNNMEDIQLAILLCRLSESPNSKSIEDKPLLKKLIQEEIIGKGVQLGDTWLVSIGETLLGNHVQSVNVLS